MNLMYESDMMNTDYMPYAQDNQNQVQQQMQLQQMQQSQQLQQPNMLQQVERDLYYLPENVERDASRAGRYVEKETRRGASDLTLFYRRNRNMILFVLLLVLLYVLYSCGVFNGLIRSTSSFVESTASAPVQQIPQIINSAIPLATIQIPNEVRAFMSQ